MANLILSSQNYTENIKLLCASSVAYKSAKRGEILITYILIILSVSYPACYLIIKDSSIILILSGCSFLLTLFIQIFSVRFKGNTSKGALFKEEFDINVFGLRWKSTLIKPEQSEVLHLSQKYKGKEIKDWYSPLLSEKLEHNTAVAVLQHTNTSWDIALRKSYKKYLTNFLVLYTIVLFLLFIILKTGALTIFLLLFSILSFYTHFISLIRGHSGAVSKREIISRQLDVIIKGKKVISTDELRDIQDEIYLTRQEPAKVPDFFFKLHRKKLNTEAEKYIKKINELYEL